MSKKTTIICSCIVFVLLVALMACEVMNPTGGVRSFRQRETGARIYVGIQKTTGQKKII